MNYRVYTIDNKPTDHIIVNALKIEDAERVWYMFNDVNNPVVIKPMKKNEVTLPSNFSCCIMKYEIKKRSIFRAILDFFIK